MSNHLIGTLDLAKAVIASAPAWVAACGSSPPAAHVVTGMAGWPYEDAMLTDAGAAALALPIAQLAIDEGHALEPTGHHRWQRSGAFLIDVAMHAPRTPAGYRAATQLADDLLDAFRAACDTGALIATELTMPGPPICYPPEAPPLLRGAWAFRLRAGWITGRPNS